MKKREQEIKLSVGGRLKIVKHPVYDDGKILYGAEMIPVNFYLAGLLKDIHHVSGGGDQTFKEKCWAKMSEIINKIDIENI